MQNVPLRHISFVLVCLFLCLASWTSCGGRNVAVSPPPASVPVTPYVRLATYNAIIAEANLAAARAVRSAADVQLLPPETVRGIFAWQERLARASKALAVLLSDSSVDLKSAAVTSLVLDLAAPPLLDKWMGEMTSQEQQMVLASLRSLANTIALVIGEFGHPDAGEANAWDYGQLPQNARDQQQGGAQ